jgi:hypothetical protein
MHSNAVQQFETWSREESTFRAASLSADQERKRIEASLQQLRLQHKQLSSDTRESADLLGRFHRDFGLLIQEKERLSQQLKEERTMIEQCSHENKEHLLQGKSSKAVYQSKIEMVRTQLIDLQYQKEAQCLDTMISAKTVVVLQGFLSESKIGNENEKVSEFMDTLQAWNVVANAHEHAIAEIDHLTNKVKSLRHLATEIVKEQTMKVRASLLKTLRHGLSLNELTAPCRIILPFPFFDVGSRRKDHGRNGTQLGREI